MSYATKATTLYIKVEGEHTPKGEVEKNYLICPHCHGSVLGGKGFVVESSGECGGAL